jgi:hypothetical protein
LEEDFGEFFSIFFPKIVFFNRDRSGIDMELMPEIFFDFLTAFLPFEVVDNLT